MIRDLCFDVNVNGTSSRSCRAAGRARGPHPDPAERIAQLKAKKEAAKAKKLAEKKVTDKEFQERQRRRATWARERRWCEFSPREQKRQHKMQGNFVTALLPDGRRAQD